MHLIWKSSRPGTEPLADRYRAVARSLPTTGLVDKKYNKIGKKKLPRVQKIVASREPQKQFYILEIFDEKNFFFKIKYCTSKALSNSDAFCLRGTHQANAKEFSTINKKSVKYAYF